MTLLFYNITLKLLFTIITTFSIKIDSPLNLNNIVFLKFAFSRLYYQKKESERERAKSKKMERKKFIITLLGGKYYVILDNSIQKLRSLELKAKIIGKYNIIICVNNIKFK